MSENESYRSRRIAVGIIRKPIGLDGTSAVEPLGHSLERLLFPVDVFIGLSENDVTLVSMESVEFRPKGPVCHFSGISTADQVEALRGAYIFIAADHLPKLDNDTYYHFDLIGLKVQDDQGRVIGSVIAVHNFPTVDSVEVTVPGLESIMIPLTADALVEIDQKSGFLTVQRSFIEELM